jgi:excisionase family DNA binding protein
MGNTLTVAEAARLLGRTTDAVRQLIARYGIEKIYHDNGYFFRVRAADVQRVGKKSQAR